ncbi:flavin-containing amine oxidoreductase-domain containing protein [Rhizoctonia solani]|nr:flavin-containing amine oxidoreductase-domain containing protein [Rhizoctonia solani]
MRFPQIPSMERVFKLFEYPPLNQGDLALKDKLKPFHFVGAGNNNTFFNYNGVSVCQNAMPDVDPFKAEAVLDSPEKKLYIAAGAKNIADDVIRPFAAGILDDLKNRTTTGWDHMMKYELHSTRSYMSIAYEPDPKLNLPKGPLPSDVVNWCETFDKSTGWYDRSLSETVLEAIAFGWQPDSKTRPTHWFCIDGGSEEIAKTMRDYIVSRPDGSNRIVYNSRVTSIALNDKSMQVVANNTDQYEFSHVISTIPLPVLRVMDLSKAELAPLQSNAIRELNYGPSIKIGLQFRSAWWTTGRDRNNRPLNIVGGQTYTDRPLRTVVYPSFGNIQAGETTTLIASYCWTEDAERLGALIDKDDETLKTIVLKELAEIHNVSQEFLRGQLIGYHAWSWSHDPYTMGAFAFFGPSKFGSLYKSLTIPAAKGRLHFAGEAVSVRHAWVEGALDSAWRAVSELLVFPGYQQYKEKFYKNWGINEEWIDTPKSGDTSAGGKFPILKSGKLEINHDLILRHMAFMQPELFE